MATHSPLLDAHPAGEPSAGLAQASGAWPLDTPGGRYYAEWDDDVPVTREGQLIFFMQFLRAGGLWTQLLEDCPLAYRGNRGSGADAVLGTLLLSILNGHFRYAHINAVRGDGVNPGLLGLPRTVSEDTVRHAARRLALEGGPAWVQRHLIEHLLPALSQPWILDVDSTIKPIYGHQEGAQIGYNPGKPGRPSHVYHSYFVANLRLCLGVEVTPGKQHAGVWGMAGLWERLDAMPRSCWPAFVRGDCSYGSEKILTECEQRGLPYLFKLRQTARVRDLVVWAMHQGERWHDCGDGWQAMETPLKLKGWSQARRVILVREAAAHAPVGPRRRRDRQEPLPHLELEQQAAPWSGKIAVLVSSLPQPHWPLEAMPRQYRERADAENNYDELKNQWGWNGYTSQHLGASAMMANLVGLVYNWWSLYVRFYDEEHHREAIRCRPMLMAGVGRQVRSGGQRTVKVSILYEKGRLIAQAVEQISNELQRFISITERWDRRARWSTLLTRLLRAYLGGKWLPGVPPQAALLLSG